MEVLGEWTGELPQGVPLHPDESLKIPEMEIHSLARRKLMNSSIAQQKFKRSVLEASSDLIHEFHGPYLSRLMMSEPGQNLLDANNPASTFETVKKGFLFHLNSTGHYLVLREHLRHAVTHIIQQCGLTLRPQGFKDHKEFQNFLHDMYIFLADSMHETLNETDVYEVLPTDDPQSFLDRKKSLKVESSSKQLLSFAEEAMVLQDWENCQRLHLQRICLNSEDPVPWVDYAIMWCARGDCRMAELALREALKIEPTSLHALLLSGLIAARHHDDRAIGFVGQALKQHPLAPELVVLLGCVHQMMGNQKNAKYFFLKARLLHCLLTGHDPSQAETDFKSFSFSSDSAATPVKEEERGSRTSRSSGRKSKVKKKKKEKGDGSTTSRKSSKKEKKRSKSKDAEARVSDVADGSSSKKGSKAKRKSKSLDAGQDGRKKISDMIQDESNVFSKKLSITGKDSLKTPITAAVKVSYDFPIEINEETVDQLTLPLVSPLSILFPWDVTQVVEESSTERVKSIVQLCESQFKRPSPETLETDQIQVLSNFQGFLERPQEYRQSLTTSPISEPPTSRSNNKGGSRKSSRVSNDSTPETSPRKKGKKKSKKKSKDLTEPGSTKSGKSPRSSRVSNSSKHRKSKEEAVGESGTAEGPEPNVWTKRLGSEYIWAAQLLLRYHIYDFLDMCLARELFLTETQSLAFIYSLCQSLNLRGRDKTAVKLISDAVQKEEQSKNPYLWELKGHIHCALAEDQEATESYQKSLEYAEPEENMQVTYLRYGSLANKLSNSKLAKTVFLKGVHMYNSLYMWIILGDICYNQEKFTEAEAAYAQANRMDNTNPSVWGHLSVVSLAQGNKNMSEQCYKWAIRFGLKDGPLLDEIKRLQEKRGYGDPSFPRVPNCIPHAFFLKRLGLDNPLEIYRQALETPQKSPRRSSTDIRNPAKVNEDPPVTREKEKEEEDEEEEGEEEEEVEKAEELEIQFTKRPSQLFK